MKLNISIPKIDRHTLLSVSTGILIGIVVGVFATMYAGNETGVPGFSQDKQSEQTKNANYVVSVEKTGKGKVAGASTYSANEEVQITAEPSEGSYFLGWRGDKKCTGTNSLKLSFRMPSRNIVCKAEFGKPEIGAIGHSGGIVFWVDSEDSSRGLEAAPEDIGEKRWRCTDKNYNTKADLGAGDSNTKTVVQNCDDRRTAITAASDFKHNGYKDWSLPSLDELDLLFEKLYLESEADYEFKYEEYWSSTEDSDGFAQFVNFPEDVHITGSKIGSHGVRPIREFDL